VAVEKNQLSLILGVIAKRAMERGSLLTKVRLVKFLYLLDLFWAQNAGGETLTGWPWAFVHYGPYCRESTDAIDFAASYEFLAADRYESNYGDSDYQLFKPGYRIGEMEEAEVRRMLPLYVTSHLFGEVEKWCGDTYGLLDYVYFHTGPMRSVRPGELLSFAGERKIDYSALRPVKLLPLSQEKKKALRDVLDRMKKENDTNVARRSAANAALRLYDDAYFEALSALDEDETPVGLSGIASVTYVPPFDDD